MNLIEMRRSIEYLRDNAFPVTNEERLDYPEGPAVCPQSSNRQNPADEDISSREREERLALWMENIKAFIRSIDVSKL